MERHSEGGCVYGIRFFSRSSVRPAPARASASRRMVFTASPRTKRSKGACCRCRGKTCLQITKTAYRAKNSVDGFQLRQQESNLRWGSQSPLPYRLAMAHHAKQYSIFSAVPQEVRRIFAAFSVRCLPHLRRFGSVFGLCGRDPAFSIFFHVFTKGKFCGMRFSKNTVRRGHKIHIAKVKFIFFLIFLIIFSKDCIFCCGSGTLDVIKIS